MTTTDVLRAALAAAELEEQLILEKNEGGATPETKHALRNARARHRALRSGQDPDDGTARPDTITSSAGVNTPGDS